LPLAARAQQAAMPVIGYLHSASPEPYSPMVSAFRQGLAEAGYVDGQNVTRWAEGQFNRLPALAAELVARRPAILVAAGGDVSAVSAKAQRQRFRSYSRSAEIRWLTASSAILAARAAI